MEEKDTYSLETVINTLKGKDVKTQLRILFNLIDNLKDDRNKIESEYEEARRSNFMIKQNLNYYIKAMYLNHCLSTLKMYIEYLDSYLDELISKSNGKG